jgi:hypothetical protein
MKVALCVHMMKEKSLRFRLSERRYNKLKLYAASKEKTMTQVIEDWIDRLAKIDASLLRNVGHIHLPLNCSVTVVFLFH